MIRDLIRGLRMLAQGTDEGEPAEVRIRVDYGHVTVGAWLLTFGGPLPAAVWVMAFGVVKQVRDARHGLRDAVGDALSITTTTVVTWLALRSIGAGWVDSLWAVSPLWPAGAFMAAWMCVYAVVRVREAS